MGVQGHLSLKALPMNLVDNQSSDEELETSTSESNELEETTKYSRIDTTHT